MGLCSNPDKLKKKKFRKRKTSYSTGRNAGHRHRGKPSMASSTVDWEKGPAGHLFSVTTLLPVPGTSIEVSNTTDEMWDTHGYIQNWYNPLCQEYYHVGDVTLPPITHDAAGGFGGGIILDFKTTSPSLRNVIRQTLPFLDSAALDELALRSEEKLSSVVDNEVSIANFIIELIQLCTGNVKGIQRFQSIYQRAIKAYQAAYKRFLKQGHKELAARWLAWNFAIKPALKDLRSILCGISSAYKKMKWLQDHNHSVVYLDYRRDDLFDQISFDPTEYVGDNLITNILDKTHTLSGHNGTYVQQVRYVDYKIDYHARSKIFLEIPDKYLEGAYGLSTLWAAMQGLHNPVGIIWEAIPFSWLIDYFLSYRARLWQRIYDYNPYNEGVTVLGFGHSFTVKVVGDARVFNTLKSTTFHSYGAFKYRIKVRREGLPFPEETTLFRLPDSWYQASILGALGVGISPRRR